MTALVIVSGLVAITALNAAWWWRRDEAQRALIYSLRAQLQDVEASVRRWEARAAAAEQGWRELAKANASLEERNQMLTDLLGGGKS